MDKETKCVSCQRPATQRRGREKLPYCDKCAARIFRVNGGARGHNPPIKNRYRLSEGDVAHLQMNNAFSTKAFQSLLDWQKERHIFCSGCKSIALKIGMQPKGGWVEEIRNWHKFHTDLDFGGNQ